MYLEHFQLKELPFRLSPDPAFLYLSQIHSRAKAYMESTIWFTDGFVVITGEIGSGKTTLIETFLKELEQDVVVAQINQTQISPIEFLQTLLAQFGFSPFKMRKAELLATLNQFLIEQYANGRKVLLIVDEAQNLTNKVLEEVRLLSGVETTKEKVLRIILAGQPELNDKLDSPDLVQLKQRVRLRFHLTALSESDAVEYVRHRLRVAGAGEREVFEPDTFPLIYRYTGGIPRLTNTLCDTALLAAFAQDRPTVSSDDVRSAIAELQWVEYAARTSTHLQRTLDARRPRNCRRWGGWCCRGHVRRRTIAAGRPRGHHAQVVLSLKACTGSPTATSSRRGGDPLLVPDRCIDRSHVGQRPADRQQVREPPPRAGRDARPRAAGSRTSTAPTASFSCAASACAAPARATATS
jgi:type II secretory pathway predicted ATPase ExeA